MSDAPPPPPPGFQLDASAPPPPPPGFKVDGAPSSAKPSARSRSYGATDLAASKFTFGLGDKAAAAGDAVGGYLHDLVAGKSGASVSDRYDTSYAAEIAAKKQYQDAHPTIDALTSPLSFVAGGPAATGLKGVRAGIVAGTAAGTAQAAGDAHGTVGQQAGQIALGAGLGAATGGVAAHVVPKVLAAAAPVVQRIAGRLAPNVDTAAAAQTGTAASQAGATSSPISLNARIRPSRAERMIADAMAADNNSPRQVGQMVQDAQNRGVPLAIADTGDNVRGLASAVARQPGAGRTIMRDAVVGRQEGQTERLQGAIVRDLGPTVGVATEAQNLEASASAAAKPLYDAAYAAGPVDHPTIKALLQHPEIKSALDAGAQLHAHETFLANAKGEAPPEPLTPGFPDVRTLDYAKRALDQRISAAYSGNSAEKIPVGHLKDLRSTLVGALDEAVPAYGAARAAYAGPMQSAEALTTGKAAINKSADEIAASTSAMGAGELDQFKLGFRSALSDKIEGQGDYADKIKTLVGSPKKRAVLGSLFGGQDSFDKFLSTLSDEAKTSLTHARINAGSSTAANSADDAQAGNQALAGAVGKAGLKAALGHHIGAITGLIGDVNDHAARKVGEGIRAELASALSETDPAVLTEALRQARIARVQASRSDRRTAPAGRAAAIASGRAGGDVGGYVGSLLRQGNQ